MPRPSTSQRDAAIQEIIRCLRDGYPPTSLAARYKHVPKRTWARWIAAAREQTQGEDLPPEQPLIRAALPPPGKASSKARPGAKAKAKAKSKPAGERKSKSKPPPQADAEAKSGTHIPKGEPDPDPDPEAGYNEDEDVYIVITPEGPKQVGLTRAVIEPGKWKYYGLLERLDEIFNLQMGMHDAALKRVPGKGHVYLDAQQGLGALAEARKTADSMIKAREKVRSMEEIARFSECVMAILRKQDPAIAAEVASQMQSAIQDLSSATWSPPE